MSNQRIWESSGWPWGLELLALIFVLAAIIIPWQLAAEPHVDMESLSIVEQRRLEQRQQQQTGTFEDFFNFFWSLGILGLYGVHLLMASSSINQITTSFTHLFSPLIFSMITYYRLAGVTTTVGGEERALLSNTPGELILWILIVFALTLLLARVRAIRHGLKFKRVEWDVNSKAARDSTFWSELAWTIRPLIYKPLSYMASDEGILIKGWLFYLPLSYNVIQSVEAVRKVSVSESATFYSTTTKGLVRVQVKDTKQPIYISPSDREAFIAYCNRHLNRGSVVSLARDDSDDE